jgi:hypothetical protein
MQPKIFWIASLALLLIMLVENVFFTLDLLTSDSQVEFFFFNFILLFPLIVAFALVLAKKNFGYYLSLVLGGIFLCLYIVEFVFFLSIAAESLLPLDVLSFVLALIVPPALLLFFAWKSKPFFQETQPKTYWSTALIILILVFLFQLALVLTLVFYYQAMVAAEYFNENLVYVFNSLLIQSAIFIVILAATALFFLKNKFGFYSGLLVPVLLAIISLVDICLQLIEVLPVAEPLELLSMLLALLGSMQPGLLIILFYCTWKSKPVFEAKKSEK